jgi:hypothetical protein
MGQLVSLEINQDVATKETVVENKVYSKVVVVERESLLPSFKEKTFAEFQEERLQLVDDGGFKFVLGIVRTFFEPEEFQNERVLDEVGGFFHDLPLNGESANFVLVAAEGESLVKAAGNLSLEFSHAPLVGGGLDLVKSAFVGVIQSE